MSFGQVVHVKVKKKKKTYVFQCSVLTSSIFHAYFPVRTEAKICMDNDHTLLKIVNF